jgi:uncharacterized repeat protein (TIGR01451 family)
MKLVQNSATRTGFALVAAFLVIGSAQAAITGAVFKDFNSNGVRDAFEPGFPGVAVKVYGSGAAAGTLCSSVLSDVTGAYTALSAAEQTLANCSYVNGAIGAVDEYRLEFVLPAGAFSPGASGAGAPTAATDSNTLVRVVGNGANGIASGTFNISDVNLAVQNPGDYCPAYVEQANGGDTSLVNPPTASVMLATPIAVGPPGAAALPPGTKPVLLSYQYEAGSSDDTNTGANLPTRLVHATQAQIGMVRGLAYHRRANALFAAPYAKRHTTFPDGDTLTAGQQNNNLGPDQIYKVYRGTVPVAETAVSTFVTIDAGSDTHNLAALELDNSYWNQVGRAAWGDIDMLEDDSALYGSNQSDKLLYRIPVNFNSGTGAVTSGAAAAVYTLSQLNTAIRASGACNLSGSASTADDDDWVLGAVKAKDGRVYFGVTCTAQAIGEAYAAVSGAARCEGALSQGIGSSATNTTTSRNAFNFASGFVPLRAVVFSFNPTTPGAAPTLVNSVPLNYDRDSASAADSPAEWLPWRPSQPAASTPRPENGCTRSYTNPFGQAYYMQPWLTDIEFDENNNMLLGLNDRGADQFGNVSAIGGGSGNFEGVGAGDIVRIPLVAGAWPASGANGEFHKGDEFVLGSPTHSEITLGSMAVVLGRNEVVANSFDPPPSGGSVNQLPPNDALTTNSFQSGGIVWLSSSGGASAAINRNRSYLLFTRAEAGTFGKASGVGDIEAICAPAPLQIGSRIYRDRNFDGIQNVNPDGSQNGESGLDNVTIFLVDANGNKLGQTTSNPATLVLGDGTSGQYFFNISQGPAESGAALNDANVTLPNPYGQALFVVVDSTEFLLGGDLIGFLAGPADQGVGAAGTTGVNETDQRDSDFTTQIIPGAGVLSGSQLAASVTTGQPGQNNHSVDQGFGLPTDYGDLPNTYGTLTQAAVGGVPRHTVVAGIRLGALTDSDASGFPSSAADGDDLSNIDDEDSANPAQLTGTPGSSSNVTLPVAITSNGGVCAYFDWNNDGDFADASEILYDQVLAADTAALFTTVNSNPVAVPISTPTGTVRYARFRLSTAFDLATDCTIARGVSEAILDGEIEDYTFQVANLDFGDLPAVYGVTTVAENGARHAVVAGLGLGALVDGEADGAPSAAANGDGSDEDSVLAGYTLFGANGPTVPVAVTNTTGSNAGLCGFLDINGDNDFADAGEVTFVLVPTATSTATLVFNGVSGAVVPTVNPFLRVRIASEYTSAASCAPTGGAQSGEVEDHRLNLTPSDFGDLPDTGIGSGVGNYETSVANGGPYASVGAARLGATIDSEANGNPGAPATGDGSDEDALIAPAGSPGSPLILILPYVNTTNALAARVCGFVDLNRDGDFTDANESASATVAALSSGNATLNFGTISAAISAGDTYSRFRIGDAAAFTSPVTCPDGGFSGNGEVEDYVFRLLPEDFGDLPDTGIGSSVGNYSTTVADNGARHSVTGDLALGASVSSVDTETDGAPNAAAAGDDSDNTDDEDGVAATIVAVAGSAAPGVSVQVSNSGAAAGLCSFIDLNNDGVFTAPNEVAFNAILAVSGTTIANVNFTGSVAAAIGNSTIYFRTRLSRGFTAVGTCAASGAQSSGEVEDYPVSVTASGDVGVVKSVLSATYTAGQAVTYSIIVTNNGVTLANNVQLLDVVPAEFAQYDYNVGGVSLATVVSGGSGSGSSNVSPIVSPGTVSATLDLQPGGSVEIIVSAVVRMTTTVNPLVNTATLAFPPSFTDTNPGNNSSSIGITPSGTPGSGVGFTLCSNPAVRPDLTISTVNAVINTYFTPAASGTTALAVGLRCLPTNSIAGIGAAPTALSSIAAGDRLLIVQMQDGSTMSTADTAGYGSNFLANNGVYEYVSVRGPLGAGGCASTEIPINGASGGTPTPTLGLMNSYSHAPLSVPKQVVQYVRIPQLNNLTITGSNSIAAAPWDGTRGGIVAADVAATFDTGASASAVNAACMGYRGGGVLDQVVALVGNRGTTPFRRTVAIGNGMKGEGPAGTPSIVYDGTTSVNLGGVDGYVNGATGRGAAATAGGGGNACSSVSPSGTAVNETAGGSGGGNGGAGGTGGNCITDTVAGTGSGTGGVPGRTLPDFTFNGINTAGDLEALVGRITMGGGGGAGARSGSTGDIGTGGRGGGIILISAGTIIGSGDLNADGCSGNLTTSANSGGGGGGAGGTAILLASLSGATNYAGIDIKVRGANGANAGVGSGVANRRGPGGAGGGGRAIASRVVNNAIPNLDVATGANGTTDAGSSTFGASNADQGDGIPSVNAYNSVPGAKPSFLCAGGTVAVTLSDVDAKVIGAELVVEFGTASEAGTLGYRVYQDQPNLAAARLGGDLVLSKGEGSSLVPNRYSVRGPAKTAKEVWIEEVTTTGEATMYGPYKVGTSRGEKDIAVKTNWAAIQAEQNVFRSQQASTILRNRGSASVEARVSQDGLVRISFAQLSAVGLDLTAAADVSVKRGGTPIALNLEASSLSFLGESVKGSIYTDTSIYVISAGRGLAMASSFAGAGNLPSVSSYQHTETFAPNRGYSFSSPTADPWFATRIVRSASSAGSATETITASDRDASSVNNVLTLDVWGGTSYAAVAGDHSLAIRLNGIQVATRSFDGFSAQTIRVGLPAGLLLSGANTVTVELMANGAPADVVYLESIKLDYTRSLKVASNGQVRFAPAAVGTENSDRMFADNLEVDGVAACLSSDVGCASYSVTISSPSASAYRVRGGQASRLTATRTVGSTLKFADVAQAGDEYLVQQAANSAALSVATPIADVLSGTNVSYVVITHPSFVAGLSPLLAAKQAQGLTTKVVNVESLYANYTDGELSPLAIQAYLREAKAAWPTLKYVLLVGGDTYDYKNYTGNGSLSFVPTIYRRTNEFVAFTPADQGYSDVTGDGAPDLAVGRMPVRTLAELDQMVAKSLAYSTAGNAKTVTFANDRDSVTYPFGSKARAFGALLNGWTASSVDLNSFANDNTGTLAARASLQAKVNAGTAVLGYYGHSSPSNWTRESLLTNTLLNQGLFSNATKPTSVVQFGCWGAYFVDPQYNAVAHGLLLNAGGAANLVAASGLTEVSSDELLANQLLPRLSAGKTIGEVALESAAAIKLSNPEALDVWLGITVLGDPAAKVNN